MGYDCFARNGFVPRAAKRFQRGQVRVLKDLKGWQIVGLYKVFDNSDGMFPGLEDAINFCKHVCYSDIRCEYWSYAPNFGCWVEDAAQEYRPSYPLTLTSALSDTEFGRNSVAGEYIQHFCDPQMVSRQIPQTSKNLTRCAEMGYRYDPPNMALQDRTIVSDYEACRQRCKVTVYCAFFAFWPDGGCHITDKFANKVPAENWYVISGPIECSTAFVATSPHPEAWLHTPAVVPGSPDLLEKGTLVMAEIAFTIHNLDLTQFWRKSKKEELKIKYAEAIATTLGCTSDMVRDANGPDAGKGLVKLTAGESTGRRLFSSASETLVTAYTPNQPDNSEDTTTLLSKLKTKEFVKLVKAATQTVAQSSATAITGDGLAISEPEVGTSEYPLPAFKKESSSASFLSVWWPLLAAFAMVCCCCISYAPQMCDNQFDVRNRRSWRQFSDRDSTDDELMTSWSRVHPGTQGHRAQAGTFDA